MSLASFLSSLEESGRVCVPTLEGDDGDIGAEDLRDAAEGIRRLDEVRRAELAPDAPPLHLAAARWAATVLYRLCQIHVTPAIGPEQFDEHVELGLPDQVDPSICYSVDLSFRFLPDLQRVLGSAGLDDPLLRRVEELARSWPLSSVGCSLTGELGALDGFIAHRSLRHLYVDRIIARQDFSRLQDARIREEVAVVLGDHGNLAPELARTLEEEASE